MIFFYRYICFSLRSFIEYFSLDILSVDFLNLDFMIKNITVNLFFKINKKMSST